MNIETARDFKDDDVQAVNKLMSPSHDYDRISSVKVKINNLIWEEMPADTTLADAEITACRIFKMLKIEQQS